MFNIGVYIQTRMLMCNTHLFIAYIFSDRHHSYGQIFSNNIDLMSGQTTGTYHALTDYPGNRDYLPENVAKLFVKNDENNAVSVLLSSFQLFNFIIV